MATAAIALGSNLGNSRQTLTEAIAVLDQSDQIRVTAQSSWYRTAPVGPPQPDYLNGCVVVATSLSPDDLMARLLEIEAQFGRVRRERWGPRHLDLDLLLYDQIQVKTDLVEVPHPRLSDRAFVLIPLAEIAPEWIHPVTQRSVLELKQAIDPTGVIRVERDSVQVI